MKNRPLPSAEYLKRWLSYDPETGVLIWLDGVGRGRCFIGCEAGTISKVDGYRRLKLAGRRMLAHRVIWKMIFDEDPPVEIDHRDGDRANNRLRNLRLATKTENGGNKSAQGAWPKGVYQRPSGRFVAQIKRERKHHYLGTFNTPDAAHSAYVAAALALFGSFACVSGRRYEEGIFG